MIDAGGSSSGWPFDYLVFVYRLLCIILETLKKLLVRTKVKYGESETVHTAF